MMPGLAHAQPYPGATTAILLGRISDALALPGFRSVLWFIDVAGTQRRPTLDAGARLLPVTLDQAMPATLGKIIEDFIRLDARRLPSVFVAHDAVQQNVEAYQTIIARFYAELENHHRARVTRQRDGFTWQKHLLQNLPLYARRPIPATWHDVLQGVPAFICGAGPSLDVSAPKLAAAANTGIVFAADSALRTLAKHGVTADIAVSVDIAKAPEKCLPDSHRPARVVLSSISPPAWARALSSEQIYFAANRQITTDWIASLGVTSPALSVAENCGVTALELARFLGCAPIYLFGLDLALTAKQRHTTGAEASIYTQSGFDASQEYPEVPGNYVDKVPTHAIGDWRSLDQRLASWPANLVFNVNDRGACLSNTTLIHPDKTSLAHSAFDRARLDQLPAPPAPDVAALATAFDQLRAIALRESATVPALRATLESAGPSAVAAALRPLFSDKTTGRALGGFSLKILPHLLPPTEGDSAFWSALIDEFAELLAHAQNVR